MCACAYLGEAHQHQQGEQVGASERVRQLLHAVVGEGGDDHAPLGARVQTSQDVRHRARPVQADATATR